MSLPDAVQVADTVLAETAGTTETAPSTAIAGGSIVIHAQ